MNQIVRNLVRRKLRSFLTISGIVIGILALTTMGALANNFNALLDGGAKYIAGYVSVGDASSNGLGGSGVLPLAKQSDLAAVPGVARVFPSVSVAAKPASLKVVSLGIPDYISSLDPAEYSYSALKITYASGRTLGAASGEVVLGSNFATEFNKKVGDTITLPIKPSDANADFVQHTYTVVGILDKTLTEPDTGAFVSLTDSQQLLKDQLSPALQTSFDQTLYVTGFDVFGTPGTNLDTLADRINAQVSGVKAQKPSKLVAALVAGGALFTKITMAAALLALVIGGASPVTTAVTAATQPGRPARPQKASRAPPE